MVYFPSRAVSRSAPPHSPRMGKPTLPSPTPPLPPENGPLVPGLPSLLLFPTPFPLPQDLCQDQCQDQDSQTRNPRLFREGKDASTANVQNFQAFSNVHFPCVILFLPFSDCKALYFTKDRGCPFEKGCCGTPICFLTQPLSKKNTHTKLAFF